MIMGGDIVAKGVKVSPKVPYQKAKDAGLKELIKTGKVIPAKKK